MTMLLLLAAYLGSWATNYGQFYGMIIVGNKVLYQLRTQHL